MPSRQIELALPNGAPLAGSHDPDFAQVADIFRQNFLERGEVGASLCITHHGRPVLDLWGGIADPITRAPWREDTISIVFSCTKAATALCAHMLAERGQLELHAPVEALWPEFGQAGKAGTTLAMMLGHTAPVPHIRAPLPEGALADWALMIARVAAEPAWWAPGTRQGYHGLTFAWTVGNMVRLGARQPLGAYFRDQIAGPLTLDFHIGLPEQHEARVARMITSTPAEADPSSRFIQAIMTDRASLPALFMGNTGGADFNTRLIRGAEIGSANGITNARGLAGLYTPLATGGGGLVSAETVTRMSRVTAATHMDATLMQPMRFASGFMVSIDNRATNGSSLLIGEAAFGHVGMGGSVGFADPSCGLAFGYTMNRMGAGILLNARGQSLVNATYRSLGYSSDATGAWK